MMSTLRASTTSTAKSACSMTKGAPDVLLERCTRVRVGHGGRWTWTTRGVRASLPTSMPCPDAALRTLAVAYRPLERRRGTPQCTKSLERELIYVGTVGIFDPPREEAAVAIREAQRAASA